MPIQHKTKIKNYLRKLLPTYVRKYVILFGPLRGIKIYLSLYDYPSAVLGKTEYFLIKWFLKNVKLNETWLDIGAHYGYTAIALSRLVGPNGKIYAFEPMVSTAGFLKQTFILNGFLQSVVLPIALGCPDTVRQIQIPCIRGMLDKQMDHSEIGRRKLLYWKETVLEFSFDWLWLKIDENNKKIHGIKIDVQGMEIGVLKGMEKTIKRFKPKLVVELHTGVDRKEFLTLIDRLGYSTSAEPIDPVKGEDQAKFIDDRSYVFHPK